MSDLNYKIQGTGSPVVFLHGFMEDHTMWQHIISEMTNVQAISIDLPGHGKSSIDSSETMQSMAEKVKVLLVELQITSPIVIGHSMGGYVGLELLHLLDLKHLVLFHSNFWADTQLKKTNRDRVIKVVKINKGIFIREAIPNLFNPKTKHDFEPQIKDLTNQALAIPEDHIIQSSTALRDRIDHAHTIEQFCNKITIIHGLQDPIITNEELEENLSTLSKKPMLELLNNCGHMGHIERKNLVLDLFQQQIDKK